MVATCGVGLERHGLIQIGMGMCVLSQPSPTHQSPIHATTPHLPEFGVEAGDAGGYKSYVRVGGVIASPPRRMNFPAIGG
jgi:hypothetical protein